MTRRSALGLATAATLSGCSLNPVEIGQQRATPAPTGSGGPVVDTEFFARSREGSAKKLPEGKWAEQRVSTPHLDFTVEATYAGPTLSAEAAAQVEQPEGLQAPEGHEFVAFALRGGLPSYEAESGNSAAVKLVVDESRAIDLPAPFDRYSTSAQAYTKEWEFVVLCVPEGASVSLQIIDEVSEPDQFVMLDMRTGAPVTNLGWQQTAGFRERLRVEVNPDQGVFQRRFTTLDPTLEKQGGTLRIGLKPDVASGVFPWIPTLGWAPEGQQWLPVPMNVKIDVRDGEVFPRLEMKIPESFSYVTEETERVRAAHPETATTDALVTNNGALIVIWPVTGREDQALISFNPTGTMVVDYTDVKNVAAGFEGDARPLEFNLAYKTAPR